MKDNFPTALQFVLQHECVFAPGHDGDMNFVIPECVPGDAGGWTKYGIDQASHPGVNIRALTLEQATDIYRSGEWTRCCCDELPQGLDIALFDIAVNNGTGAAVLLLQRALNESCSAGLAVDGYIGPRTLGAAAACGPAGLRRLLLDRQKHYYDIVTARPTQAKFLKGWLNRNNDLARLVGVNFNALC